MNLFFAIENKTGKFGFFSGVPALAAKYPDLKADTLYNHFTRKKETIFEINGLTIYRGRVQKPADFKNTDSAPN